MTRFTVDSPPQAKPPKQEDKGTPKKSVFRHFKRTPKAKSIPKETTSLNPPPDSSDHPATTPKFKMRRFQVDKSPRKKFYPRGKKKMTRTEIITLSGIAVALILGLKGALHSDNCDTRIPERLAESLNQELSKNLFRQDQVIQNVSKVLKSHYGLTTMTFFGGCGTGKSLTAQLMSRAFEEKNSHAYHWNEESVEDKQHVILLQDLILNLPLCTPSLVIVDDLSWRQKPHVEDLHRWLMNNSRWNRVNLVILFIFNFERYGAETDEMDLESIGELKNTHLVNFKSFEEGDGIDFLEQTLGDKLDKEAALDMVRGANVRRFGLKKLANRINIR